MRSEPRSRSSDAIPWPPARRSDPAAEGGAGRRGRAEPTSGLDRDDPTAHGAHTLQTLPGTVVGLDRDDVFVDLGPRLQGLISAARFERPPSLGDRFDFHLLGQEEGLWRLTLAGTEPSLAWERMQPGLLVEARVIGVNPGGFELKAGGLHAFMPRSHSGLGRRERPRTLLGKTFATEVLEVDRERQRILVSRKLVLRKERAGGRAREQLGLRPGQVVEGRVTRLAPFGAFVRFGPGFEGLVHVSNLAHEPVRDPGDVLSVGDRVTVKVLTVRADGKRIGLGLKQMGESPWAALARSASAGEVVAGEVERLQPEGLVVRLDGGARAFAPRSALGLAPDDSLARAYHCGLRLAWRITELDVERERAVLSRLHTDGAAIHMDEVFASDDPCVEWADADDLPPRPVLDRARDDDGRPGRAARLARELVREVRDLDDEDERGAARAG